MDTPKEKVVERIDPKIDLAPNLTVQYVYGFTFLESEYPPPIFAKEIPKRFRRKRRRETRRNARRRRR